MKKVLLVSSQGIVRGGLQKYLENAVLSTGDIYKYDWYFPMDTCDEKYAKQLRGYGINLIAGKHVFNGFINRHNMVYNDLRKILKKEKYDIVYINSGDIAFQYISVKACHHAGVKRIISHSHSIGECNTGKNFVNQIKRLVFIYFKSYVRNKAYKLAACSEKAAYSVFGEKCNYVFVHNRIMTGKYAFSEKKRESIREKLKLQKDEICIGHVGVFSKVKNHKFLLSIFKSLCEMCPDIKFRLLLVGGWGFDDNVQLAAETYVNENNLDKKVVFAGSVENPQDYMAAMDLFCFPSLREGLGIVLLEAQCAGLPCVASDAVPPEVAVTNNIRFLSLEKSENFWAKEILNLLESEKLRKDCSQQVTNAGFDLDGMRAEIIQLYH